MASFPNNDFNFPHYFPPPPPTHPFHPPPSPPSPMPPHPHPPPLPPTPPPPHHHIIIIVVISCGGLFLLGALMVAFWFCIRRKRRLVRKTEDIDVDEHLKVNELVVPGPHGPRTMVLSVEDDVHVHDNLKKDEIDRIGEGMKSESKEVTSSSSMRLSHPENRV